MNETSEETAMRLANQRDPAASSRLNETSDEAAVRLANQL